MFLWIVLNLVANKARMKAKYSLLLKFHSWHPGVASRLANS